MFAELNLNGAKSINHLRISHANFWINRRRYWLTHTIVFTKRMIKSEDFVICDREVAVICQFLEGILESIKSQIIWYQKDTEAQFLFLCHQVAVIHCENDCIKLKFNKWLLSRFPDMILWEDQRWDFKFSSRTKIHFFGHRGAEKGFSSSKAYFRCWINNLAAFQKVWALNLEFFIWSNFTELPVTK